MKRHSIIATIFLLFTVILCLLTTPSFLSMRIPERILHSEYVTHIRSLSDYFDGIENTRGDTPVYFLEGNSHGGTILILGGTHPNEPAGFITTVFLLENLKVTHGRVIIIPRANNSGFTHNDPQEGNPQRYVFQTKSGERWFRYGSRSTNPIDQWPDPEVYRHYPSGQKLSGPETRNLNRSYPGRPDGSMTEKVAFAIMELMRQEHVNIAMDLHEASLEYPVINALVAHPLAYELAGEVIIYLQMEGFVYNLEPSPEKFRGLSHREWGDHLKIPSLLMESANTVQGRYHGPLTDDMVLTGKDRFYFEAAQHGLLEVEYPEEGIPLKERVGRHLIALQKIVQIWTEINPVQPIIMENIPGYHEIQEKGVGAFLR